MIRKISTIAAAAALTLGLPQLGHAQSSATSGSTSAGTATASSGGGAGMIVMPGGIVSTGTVPNTPNTQYVHTTVGGTTWTLGQTTGGNSVTSYDACLKNAQLTVLFAAVSVPLEIQHCWELRDMDAMAKFPPGSIQYEHGCHDSAWLKTDWDSGTMACVANRAKLAKSNPNDPRSAPRQGVPVVSTNMSPTVPASPPPTVVPVVPTNRQVSENVQPHQYPLCGGAIQDGCRYR